MLQLYCLYTSVLGYFFQDWSTCFEPFNSTYMYMYYKAINKQFTALTILTELKLSGLNYAFIKITSCQFGNCILFHK